MTAPNGAIVFNSSTGNDITASGLGSANVYGSGASTTGSSAVVTGIDTTGVSSGDLLWVQSSSGRQFSIIFTVDSSTQVTCDDVFANTESGRTWAIGGKRATFDNADSRRIINEDSIEGWIVETETDQAITSTINRTNDLGFIVIRGSGNTKKTITASSNFNGFYSSYRTYTNIQNLKFVGSVNNTSTAIVSGGTSRIRDCVFGDAGQNTNFLRGIDSQGIYIGNYYADKCVLYGQGSTVANGKGLASGGYQDRGFRARNCFVKDFYYGCYSGYRVSQITNVIVSNATLGSYSAATPLFADGCIFSQISSHAIQLNYSGFQKYWHIESNAGTEERIWGVNIFRNIGGDVFNGFNATSSPTESEYGYGDSETCYLYNASGFTGTNFPTVTLTADPFVDAAAGDFNLNADAGGGATLRASNYALNTDTSIYPFRQYVSSDFDKGGTKFHPLS